MSTCDKELKSCHLGGYCGNEKCGYVDGIVALTPEEAEKIKDIQQPTLIIFGEKDQLINSQYAYLFQKDIIGSIAFVLPGVGHVPMEEAPLETAKIMNDFIK